MGKRGTPCGVCQSPHRHLIEVGLTHGTSARVLGERFGLSLHAIRRHARNHLSPQVRAAIMAAQKPEAIDLDQLRASEGEGLLGQLVAQRARLQTTADLAMSLGDAKGVLAAESAITANLALVGKLLGTLAQHHHVTHANLFLTPDYLKLRTVLLKRSREFPEAVRAIAADLHALEADAAKDITAKAQRAPRVIEHRPPVPAAVEAPRVMLPPPPC